MKEKFVIVFAMFILAVAIPYLGTMLWSGVTGTVEESIENITTGKTVSMELDGEYVVMDVEAYLAGVLPAVLDGGEEPELWEALAIIERTNIYKKLEGRGNIDEEELGMRYVPAEELQTRWGEKNYEAYSRKIEKAILATKCRTITYDGEWIEALYHRISVGTTVSAEELYGEQIPYLTAVASSHDVEAKDYMYLEYVSKSQTSQLEITDSTEHGYVKKVMCDGEEMTGEELQERYQLPSQNFYIEDMGEQYRIVCLGQGHGMGLSIYGAEWMAENGSSCNEILQYYYPGTQIVE